MTVLITKKFHLEIDEKTIKIILRPIREKIIILTKMKKLSKCIIFRESKVKYFMTMIPNFNMLTILIDIMYLKNYIVEKRTQKKELFLVKRNENENEIIAILECLWLPLENKYSSCNMIFSISEIGILAEIKFSFDKYNQWRDIMNEAKVFVFGFIKDEYYE
ncbi:hypothetical protein AB6F20_05250 [Providencia hangzhouensis]|uniref:hypothetical protein n=1 Tax=Providencia hangzhouensis TaxID=3031799 RepID=UPI0034DCDA52